MEVVTDGAVAYGSGAISEAGALPRGSMLVLRTHSANSLVEEWLSGRTGRTGGKQFFCGKQQW